MIVSEKPDHAGFKQAYPYYLTAAEGGLADAQYAMANIHRQGIGVDFADAVAAREWMQKAAIGGLDSAQVELGIWLANGRGGEANPQRALRWFFRAAAQGNAIAQNRLAKMFLHGIGTKPDLIEAAKWNVLARRAGNRDAELDRMFDNLSDIDRKRAIEAANRISAR
jgi:TPR repeat protein